MGEFVRVREGRRLMRRAARMAVAQVITFGLVMSPWMLGQQPELKSGGTGNSGADRPSKETLTGEVLFARVVEHNRQREADLKPGGSCRPKVQT